MKIGIVYATKRKEATVRIVSWMKSFLEGKGHTVVAEKVDTFNDFSCDYYIIGTAVYAFSVNRAGVFKFLKSNKNKLLEKPLKAFIVCGANKLPPKEESTDNLFLKFFKYTFINPDRYKESFLNHFSKKNVDIKIFKGYQEEADKIKDNFDAQETAVRKWIENIIK